MKCRKIRLILLLMLVITVTAKLKTTETINAATTQADSITWYYTVENGCAVNVYTTNAKKSLTVPEKLNGYKVISIGSGTEDTPFTGDIKNLVTVHLPSTVEKINDFCFKDTNNLVAINSKEEVCLTNIEIGSSAFKNSGLRKINLLYLNNAIGDNAFQNCSNLQELYVGNNITYLGNYCFKGCTSIKNLETDYPYLDNQFQDCYNLENIVFGENVQEISPEAFLIRNAGGVQSEIGESMNDTDNYLSNAIIKGTPIKTRLPKGSERNWYFLNNKTKILDDKVEQKGSSYRTINEKSNPVGGWITMLQYTTTNLFLPCTSFNRFMIQYNGANTYNTCLSFYFDHNGETFRSAYSDIHVEEYFNTPTGFAKNNIFVPFGNTEKNSPENAQENASEIYKEMANNQINTYVLEKEDVPEFKPLYPISINATLNDAEKKFYDGDKLSKDDVIVEVVYSDGSKVPTSDFAIDDTVIKPGSNCINISLNDGSFSTSVTVTGYAYPVSLNASLKDSSKAFRDGDKLSKDDVIVEVVYSDGSTVPTSDFAIDDTVIKPGSNCINISLNDGSFSTSVTVTGYAYPVSLNASLKDSSKALRDGDKLSNDDVIVEVVYSDGSTVPTSDFAMDDTVIKPGSNCINISLNDGSFSTSIDVIGNAYPVSLNASLKDNSKAFQDGEKLSKDDVIVEVVYSDGSTVPTSDFAMDDTVIKPGSNNINISLNGSLLSTLITLTGKENTSSVIPVTEQKEEKPDSSKKDNKVTPSPAPNITIPSTSNTENEDIKELKEKIKSLEKEIADNKESMKKDQNSSSYTSSYSYTSTTGTPNNGQYPYASQAGNTSPANARTNNSPSTNEKLTVYKPIAIQNNPEKGTTETNKKKLNVKTPVNSEEHDARINPTPAINKAITDNGSSQKFKVISSFKLNIILIIFIAILLIIITVISIRKPKVIMIKKKEN